MEKWKQTLQFIERADEIAKEKRILQKKRKMHLQELFHVKRKFFAELLEPFLTHEFAKGVVFSGRNQLQTKSQADHDFAEEMMHRFESFMFSFAFPERIFFCFQKMMMPPSLVQRIYFYWKKKNGYEMQNRPREKEDYSFVSKRLKKGDWLELNGFGNVFQRTTKSKFRHILMILDCECDTETYWLTKEDLTYLYEMNQFLISIFKIKNPKDEKRFFFSFQDHGELWVEYECDF